jgi:3-oxoacyl-[acyl-carrier-protein] synthase-3
LATARRGADRAGRRGRDRLHRLCARDRRLRAAALNLPGGGSLNPSSHETVDKKMHFIHQDGPAVYKFAVRKMAECTTTLLERNGVTGADLGCFIPHQANKRIIASTADRLGLAPERVIINIEKYGNTSAGSIPWPWRQRLKRAS